MGKLSPGFRFHPTDVELVKYYLKRKVLGKKLHFNAIAEVDIYKFAPWDLPDMSPMRYGDLKWYFFCPSEKKYASGARLNRSTEFGYWKTTGRDRPVHYNSELVGMIKTLVFHRGKAPKGDRTGWVMHEYRLEDRELADNGVIQLAYVLCKVFQKDGLGPRNGAQYGAPFREEDWSDDEEEVNIGGAVSPGETSTPALSLPFNQTSFIETSSHGLQSMFAGPSYVPCPQIAGYSACEMLLPVSGSDMVLMESESQCTGSLSAPRLTGGVSSGYEMLPPVSGSEMVLTKSVQPWDDEIPSLLASFAGQHDLFFNENDIEKLDSCYNTGIVEAAPCSEGNYIYNGLADLINFEGQSSIGYGNVYADYETGFSVPCNNEEPYVELIDLDRPFGATESELGNLGSLYGQSCHGDNISAPGGEESYLELLDLDPPLRPAPLSKKEINDILINYV
ncbi:NAC domain-containing protein 74-like isoform X1 [Tripterygium wilfordii]|uniref:NAC domain-containing protein 74-like isoform X1 n=1 Tax=Tripterygium wilfordii TaxID=458696 RepID=A0A7J7DCH1_TRIWF|nr:NAC domain-containing protein 82-like [Tripterygium wilfordii]KAF5743959.1 NAC domain-containing protein 74-like isoform X1 [Tripterygium wilfordii]